MKPISKFIRIVYSVFCIITGVLLSFPMTILVIGFKQAQQNAEMTAETWKELRK